MALSTTSSIILHAFISAVITYGSNLPWETTECQLLWGSQKVNEQHQWGQTTITRELFDLPRNFHERTASNIELAARLQEPVTWPPKERVKAADFLKAVGGRYSTMRGHWPTRQGIGATAIVDHNYRAVYLVNLKAGSTSIETVLKKDHTRRDKHMNTSYIYDHRVDRNETDVLLKCRDDPSAKFCGARQYFLKDVPDIIVKDYLVFSFVRDPFTRVVSSHHQVESEKWTPLLTGLKNRVGENTHFLSQIGHLTRGSISGKRVRLDFVGSFECLSGAWAQLQPALVDEALVLTPIERRKLILPHPPSNQHDSSFLIHARKSSHNYTFVPFSQTEKFTVLHVILVCRRYLQDFICFDMSIPTLCVTYVDLVMDLNTEDEMTVVKKENGASSTDHERSKRKRT